MNPTQVYDDLQLKFEKFVHSLNCDDFDADEVYRKIVKYRESLQREKKIDVLYQRDILNEVIFNNLLLDSDKQIELRKSGKMDNLMIRLSEEEKDFRLQRITEEAV